MLDLQNFVDPNEVHVNVNVDVHEPLAVEVNEWRGNEKLDIRHWYTRKDGKLARSRKGVSVPVENALDLMQAIADAYNEVASNGHKLKVQAVEAQA